MHIRQEQPADKTAISSLQYLAFKDHPQHEPGAEPTEHLIIEALRDAGALTLSLVAEIEKDLIGHIAFSPATIGGKHDGWFGLGPVGVLPTEQSKGIGSVLVRNALESMQEKGAKGIILVGDPAYYGRFGFTSVEGLSCPGVPPQYVMALTFTGETPKGDIAFHEAFRV